MASAFTVKGHLGGHIGHHKPLLVTHWRMCPLHQHYKRNLPTDDNSHDSQTLVW